MWQTAGQSRIINYLKDSITRDSLAHAYLFVGPPHIGKMTLAIDLARALNCPDPGLPPAGPAAHVNGLQKENTPT